MNRRIVALSLSLVGALIAAGCGGSDDLSRTRNNAIININQGGTNFAFLVDCFQDEAARASSKATAEEYWNNNVKSLEDELTTVNNIAVMPALSVAPAPREEFPDDATYEAEVARLQAEYESAKALEDVESKSKAERIARITADLEAAKTQRQKELEKIDALKLCVGDPGAGGLLVDPNVIEPCATSSSADLSTYDAKKLTIHVCDQATKVSVQKTDVNYTTLVGTEQPIGDGKNRSLVFGVQSESTDFKAIACSATGYLDTAVIKVDGENVTTERIDESQEAMVSEFCGGGAGNVSTAGNSKAIPVNADGNIDQSYLQELTNQCSPAPALVIAETLSEDQKFVRGEPLKATATLPCTITAPELTSVSFKLIHDQEGRGAAELYGDEYDIVFTKSVEFFAIEGDIKLTGAFELSFLLSNGQTNIVSFPTEQATFTVGPAPADARFCSLSSFVLSAPVDGVKTLDATCDKIAYKIRGFSSPIAKYMESAETLGDVKALPPVPPIKHIVGNGNQLSMLMSVAAFGEAFIIVSCDEDCKSEENEAMTLSRNGDTVTMKPKDVCSKFGDTVTQRTTASPLVELQPDLLGASELESENSRFRILDYQAGPGYASSPSELSMTTQRDWFVAITGCTASDGENLEGPFVYLTKVSGAGASKADQIADLSSTSDQTDGAPAVPLAAVVASEALVVPPDASDVTFGLAGVASLGDYLDIDISKIAVSFDNGPTTVLRPLGGQRVTIPKDAKVMRVTASDDNGASKTIDVAVQSAESVSVIQSDGTVSASASTENDSAPLLWVAVAVVVLAGLALTVVRRRKLAVQETTGETKD